MRTAFLLFGPLLAAIIPGVQAQHRFDCANSSGVEKARCERHERMFEKCGPLTGDAHHACDREFLLANPLPCAALSGPDAERCGKEVEAFKACEAQPGREFVRCVRMATAESPMGH
jgi:hypothetical protein